MRSAGSWMQHYRRCDGLTIRDIAVFNHVSYNNDGLNIDSCRDVIITGCTVDSDDDAVVLKSLSLTPCENITISTAIRSRWEPSPAADSEISPSPTVRYALPVIPK